MRIRIDQDRCTGHGVCEGLAPDVFEVRDDGIAYLLVEELTADLRPVLEDSCDQCPAEALSIED
jgi:ferredoxin